jgi:hypothetical protein
MNEILTLKNKDGIIQTYFDVTRPRIGTFSNKARVVYPLMVLEYIRSCRLRQRAHLFLLQRSWRRAPGDL